MLKLHKKTIRKHDRPEVIVTDKLRSRGALLKELNAVDLHWDIIARFTDTPMPLGFYDDWVRAADEESKHFRLLSDRLEAIELASFLPPAAIDPYDRFVSPNGVIKLPLVRSVDVDAGLVYVSDINTGLWVLRLIDAPTNAE